MDANLTKILQVALQQGRAVYLSVLQNAQREC